MIEVLTALESHNFLYEVDTIPFSRPVSKRFATMNPLASPGDRWRQVPMRFALRIPGDGRFTQRRSVARWLRRWSSSTSDGCAGGFAMAV